MAAILLSFYKLYIFILEGNGKCTYYLGLVLSMNIRRFQTSLMYRIATAHSGDGMHKICVVLCKEGALST